MPAKLSDSLRKLAASLDEEEAAELATAERERVDRLEARLERGGLNEEDAETLRRARALLKALDEEDATDAGSAGDGGAGGGRSKSKDSENGDSPPPRTATRPGRRRGNAYDYDLDDKGRPVKLSTARIYSGDDEPDEIEYELDAEDEDDAG